MWVKTTWTTGFFTLWAVNTNAYGNQTQLYLDSTNFVKVYDGTSDATEITSSILVGDNKWHHVVYTRSGANPTTISSTRYLAVSVVGYEQYAAATQNPYAISRFIRTV
jgi:hypothetical protein